jgi:hypothetical protein
MQFVSESLIDEVVAFMDQNQDQLESMVAQFHEQQPVIFGYIFSENLTILHQEEREFVLFLLLIIINAAKKVNGEFPAIDVKDFEVAEEQNWSLLEGTGAKSFRDRLDVFFDQTEQEDLLAFIEDALSDSEDGLASKEGREVVFVFLKSVVDCLEKLKH